jgi:hypothetical protein
MNTAKRTLISAALAAAAIAATAQGTVTFKGSVITMAPATEPVRIHLLVDGTEREVQVNANGYFKFTLQAGQAVTMRSACNGFVEKEVSIDTRNVKLATVRFDVELEEQDARGIMYYPNPVGQIAFAEGTGRILVAYDHQLMRADPVLVATNP